MRRGLLLVLPLLTACATSRARPLDARIVQAAGRVPVHKLEMRVDGEGDVLKLSLYHGEPNEVSAPVKALAEQLFPGSQPVSYELEWYQDLGLVHELELKTADGKECEVSALPDGQLRYTECKLPPAELPEPVAKAVAAAVPGGELTEAEKKEGPAGAQYSVRVKSNDRAYYLRVRPTGELIGKGLRLPAEIEVPVP